MSRSSLSGSMDTTPNNPRNRALSVRGGRPEVEGRTPKRRVSGLRRVLRHFIRMKKIASAIALLRASMKVIKRRYAFAVAADPYATVSLKEADGVERSRPRRAETLHDLSIVHRNQGNLRVRTRTIVWKSDERISPILADCRIWIKIKSRDGRANVPKLAPCVEIIQGSDYAFDRLAGGRGVPSLQIAIVSDAASVAVDSGEKETRSVPRDRHLVAALLGIGIGIGQDPRRLPLSPHDPLVESA
jgi:hypothetical protein